MSDTTHIATVLARALTIGLIVFGTITTTYGNIDVQNKLIISGIVGILYALLDYFAGFFGNCAAEHNEVSSPDTEVEDAISLLGEEDQISSGEDEELGTEELGTEELGALGSLGTIGDDKAVGFNIGAAEEALKQAIGFDLASAEEVVKKVLKTIEEPVVGDSTEPVPAEPSEGFVNYGSW